MENIQSEKVKITALDFKFHFQIVASRIHLTFGKQNPRGQFGIHLTLLFVDLLCNLIFGERMGKIEEHFPFYLLKLSKCLQNLYLCVTCLHQDGTQIELLSYDG